MKHAFILLIALSLSGCYLYRIKPTPVTMDQLAEQHYVRAMYYYFFYGEYKKKETTVLYYDGTPRVLKDKDGNLLSFRSNLAMMNFFAQHGWKYREVQRVEEVHNVRFNYLLFERTK